ncbi:MAG: corrinoid protein [Thaumarchaeota archaeon]|jgi:corrinoid protein of di/trimethylamine methyltransferase|nr:corrinoid protein [Candidatus Terraquivivens yellowstonensis]MCL7397751.1 corrinoid protein [Candidatus Terraquivivens yellowstonensis]MCL7399957.1 corrinoid protein [Candidatus Terraquivivens yellowstonensis]
MLSEYLEKLKVAVIEGNAEQAREAAIALKEAGMSPLEIVNAAIKPAMDEMGKRYERLEVFLPDLVLAGEAAQEALNVILPKEGAESLIKAKVVIGTIYGDIHDIGKNIVAAMLSANGYKVIDLGNDVPAEKFVEVAKKEGAKIIGISCLLTPSMYYMRDVIKRLEEENLRKNFYVIIGGAAVYPEWAKEIGADGWAKDAERAVELCDMLVEKGEEVPKPIILGEWR